MAKINNKPASRLDEFTSYSYYHVLVMCGDTHVANSLSSANFTGHEEMWAHPTDLSQPPVNSCAPPLKDPRPQDQQQDSRYSVKYLDNSGPYIVLINGSTDAHFSIDTFTATTTVGPVITTTQCSLVVSEPMGVSFLDTLIRARELLHVTADSAIFVLKTIFVGYTDTDRVAQTAITDIPPQILSMYDINASITETGSVWSMALFGCGTGAGSVAGVDKPSQKIAIPLSTPEKQLTIAETVKLLFDKLNEYSTKNYNCLVSQRKQEYMSANNMSAEDAEVAASKSFAKVIYSYNFSRLNDDIKDAAERERVMKTEATVYENYLVTDTGSPSITNNGKTTDAVGVNIRPDNSIAEGIVQSIINKSAQVTDIKESKEWLPRVQPKKLYHPGTDCNHTIEIVYEIHRVNNPTAANSERASKQDDGTFNVGQIINPGELFTHGGNQLDLITFDYLFTGKNTDILTMELNIANGLAMWHNSKAVSAFKPSSQNLQTTSNISPNSDLQRK